MKTCKHCQFSVPSLLMGARWDHPHFSEADCPTFGQYLVGIFDRVAGSRGQNPNIKTRGSWSMFLSGFSSIWRP